MDKKQKEQKSLSLPITFAAFVTGSAIAGVVFSMLFREKGEKADILLDTLVGTTAGFFTLYGLGMLPGQEKVDRPQHQGTINPSPDRKPEI